MSIRQFLGRLFLAIGLMSAAAPRVFACLNDQSTQRAESEYRSRYEAPAPREGLSGRSFSIAGVGGLVAGSALVVGCLRIGLRRRKNGGG